MTGASGDDESGADDGDQGETDDSEGGAATETAVDELVAGVLDGDHRALARSITRIENRAPGYRDLVARLHAHTGDAEIVGITGSPGAGKSTLVDKLALAYRERGETVGVVAIDPASPFTGGAVLGDRVRMQSTVGDMDVFVRSMSARGTMGGLSTATTDAVTALDAFGKDRVIVETVGAGQNEIDIVRTADTVVVLVPPSSGDDVQMLKAGILEIADLFVVNKADLDGSDRTVRELREMLHLRESERASASGDSGESEGPGERGSAGGDPSEEWTPPVVETVASTGEGVDELLDALADHRAYLERTGGVAAASRARYAAEIRALLGEEVHELLADEIEARGGLGSFVDSVVARETDPYTVADELATPIAECIRERQPSEE